MATPTTHLYTSGGGYQAIPEVPAKYAEVMPAYQEYVRMQTRAANPSGTFDKRGRWWADESERTTCCNTIRTPSAAYPYSQMTHCRTAVHIAHRLGVAPSLLRGLIAWLLRYYQPVAGELPPFCATCGASWECEHRAVLEESREAGLDSISIREAAAQTDRHLRGLTDPGSALPPQLVQLINQI